MHSHQEMFETIEQILKEGEKMKLIDLHTKRIERMIKLLEVAKGEIEDLLRENQDLREENQDLYAENRSVKEEYRRKVSVERRELPQSEIDEVTSFFEQNEYSGDMGGFITRVESLFWGSDNEAPKTMNSILIYLKGCSQRAPKELPSNVQVVHSEVKAYH